MAGIKTTYILYPLSSIIPFLAFTLVLAQPQPEKAASKNTADSDARREQVVASFTGGTITIGDIEEGISKQSPFMRKRYANAQQLEKLLSEMVRHELLAQEAEKRGYSKNEKVIYTIKQQAVQTLIKEEFDDQLSLDAIPIAEVKKFYNENIDQFVRPERRRVSHILLASREEAEKLFEEAKKADVREFRNLARRNSIDQETKLRGGDLRYFDKKGVVHGNPESSVELPIVNAAFRLKKIGDIAPRPIKLNGGYSIVKLTGKREAHSRSLKDAEMTIRKQLWREKRKTMVEEFIASLKEKYKPEVHPELMGNIKIESGPPGKNIRPGFPTGSGKRKTQQKIPEK